MPFLGGPVSFSRYHVVGGSPKRLEDKLLEKLREHVIGSQRTARSTGEDVGWIGGRHVLDREFEIEKNVILDCLHFGLRIDASRIPPELMHAYVQQELDALREKHNGNGNAKGLGKLKQQAMDAAKRRAAQEVSQGRYHRARQVPILWDTQTDTLYVGSTQPAVFEHLAPLFKETFDRRLERVSAGRLGYRWAEDAGVSRRLESMTPAKLVAHPSGNGHIAVYWTAQDDANRDFLGNEFLLWLWYTLTERSDTITLSDQTDAAVIIVKQLTLECPWAEFGKDVITCEGPAQLAESRRAIAAGKLPRKCGLIVSRQGDQYEFVLQAETLSISSAKLPPVEGNGNPRAGIEERVEQIRHLADTVDLLFKTFLKERVAAEWTDVRERMAAWLRAG
jgi:hypothetical protein